MSGRPRRIGRSPRRIAAHGLAVAAWCGLIFAFSAQPDLTVSDSDALDFVLRKAGHMAVFGVLALLVTSTVRELRASGKRFGPINALIGLAFAMAYAASDEWHQTFVPGRRGAASDVAIDVAGAVLALVVTRFVTARQRRS